MLLWGSSQKTFVGPGKPARQASPQNLHIVHIAWCALSEGTDAKAGHDRQPIRVERGPSEEEPCMGEGTRPVEA